MLGTEVVNELCCEQFGNSSFGLDEAKRPPAREVGRPKAYGQHPRRPRARVGQRVRKWRGRARASGTGSLPADHERFAESSQCKEEFDPQHAEPSLTREFLERRVTLNSHRLLGYGGIWAASGWEAAGRSNNEELVGFCAQLMIFVEQAALDNGACS